MDRIDMVARACVFVLSNAVNKPIVRDMIAGGMRQYVRPRPTRATIDKALNAALSRDRATLLDDMTPLDDERRALLLTILIQALRVDKRMSERQRLAFVELGQRVSADREQLDFMWDFASVIDSRLAPKPEA